MDYLSIEELITVTDFDDKDDIRNTLLHYIFEEDEELELGEEINIIDSAIDTNQTKTVVIIAIS